jgi:glycosyltransferase involved in cell wall biosynthesis
MPGPVTYLVRSWPRLSQTFVVDEILAVERRGVDLEVVSLVRSGERLVQPQVRQVRAPIRYLDRRGPRAWLARAGEHATVLCATPRRYLATLLLALTRPGLAAGYANASTRQCFGAAVAVSASVVHRRRSGTAPAHLHAHFAHDPALVALLVHQLTGLPYSLTAHARDLYQIPAAGLAARTAKARAVVTCCGMNAAYLTAAVPPDRRPPVHVVHHGVRLDSFVPGTGPRPASGPPRVVSVGRLVDKKGFPDLLRALAVLQTLGQPFSCRVYGDGPLRAGLTELRDRLHLRGLVTFLGECSSDEILRALGGADVFALTPRVTADGDRDGIPNVLVEAMACALPVVTTAAGGVTELVRHGQNGLVAEPGDVDALARHLATLLGDPPLRRELGAAARRTVEDDYDVDDAARVLTRIFRSCRDPAHTAGGDAAVVEVAT